MDSDFGEEENVDEPSEILPEDDSIFQNLSNREDNVSSDALFDTSHGSFENLSGENTSTPAKSSRVQRRGNQKQPSPGPSASPSRRVTRSSSPGPSALVSSPSRPMTRSQSPRPSALVSSPSRPMTRSQSPGPSALDSPTSRRVTRSQSPRPQPAVASRATQQRALPGPAASPKRTTKDKPPTTVSSGARGGLTSGRNQSSAKPSDSRMKCPKCPSTLANKKTLDTHLRGHLIRGITSRLPSAPDLSKDMTSIVGKVLDSFLSQPVIGELDESVHKYADATKKKINDDATGTVSEMCAILSEYFHDIMASKKIIFPSSIRNNMYIGTNKLLSSKDFKDSVVNRLQVINEECEEVLNVFFGNFIFNLSKAVLVHCVKVMRCATEEELQNRLEHSSARTKSRNFQELIFHIGGSIVAGFIYKGEGYSETSTAWAAYLNVLKTNIKCDKNGRKESAEGVSQWTEKRDRGGLTYITDPAFDFFLVSFDLIMQLEQRDGSLPQSEIDEKVLGDDVVLLLWDVLVGNELDCDQSIDLLAQIIQACVRVVIKGIIKRRLNTHLKRAYASIALRAKLVPDNAKGIK